MTVAPEARAEDDEQAAEDRHFNACVHALTVAEGRV